jgi:flagellar biosynthesis protein FliQ
MELLREALILGLWLAAPPLIAALAAGFLAGLFQGATQISDPALSALPKVAAAAAALLVWGPALFGRLAAFARALWAGP